MTKSPKVIFNSIFTLGFNNQDNKYINKNKSIKRVKDMYDYYTNEEKRVMSMYDYYTGNINKKENVNLVLENGKFATEKEIEKRKKLAIKYLENSNLWQGVLSFNNDYINKNIDIHKLEHDLATKILPMFFKHCGFKDINKMFYQIALHGDTDNLHFHFSFMEKEPNYEYSKNKVAYRRKGELNQNEIDFLKNQVIHTIEKEKIYTPLLVKTNNEIDELKKYFDYREKNFLLKDKKELLYEEKILELGQLLYKDRASTKKKIKYGSIKNKEIQDLTMEIKKYIFSKNSKLDLDYKNFKNSLKSINNYFSNIQKTNNIKNVNIDTSLINSKEEYINNYIYNAIINYSFYAYQRKLWKFPKLHEKDIIKEVILKYYINNKNQTKKDILKNYFTNSTITLKYKNKSEIAKSIKHINDEMEEAQKEFSKLFKQENEVNKEIL